VHTIHVQYALETDSQAEVSSSILTWDVCMLLWLPLWAGTCSDYCKSI